MFTDNTVFVGHNHQDAQKIITHFLKSAKVFGLKINLKKTEVMYQPPPLGSHDIGQDLPKEGQVLTQVNKYKYLDSTVASNNRLDAKLDTQTTNASKAFDGQRKRV